MDPLERIIFRLVTLTCFGVATLPLTWSGVYLTEHQRPGSLLYAVGVVLALAGVVAVFGLSRWATDRLAAGATLRAALVDAVTELRLRCAFLPVVGRLVAPRERPTNHRPR